MDITQDDLTGLGAKLDALDLTDAERAVLHAVFDAAADPPEVAGFDQRLKLDFATRLIGDDVGVLMARLSGTDLGSSRVLGTDPGSSKVSGLDLGSGP